MAIWSQSFSEILIFITLYRLILVCSRGRRISAFGLYPAYGAGVELSITPAGGV